MGSSVTAEWSVFLSTVAPTRTQRRLAGGAVFALGLAFLVAVPFARAPMPEIRGFVPCYEGALAVIDLLTAALMFAQFVVLRTQPLLVLACAYLFCAVMAVLQAFSFPPLFAGRDVPGGGAQTTAALYTAWHAGFPLAVVFYVLGLAVRPMRRVGPAVAGGIAGVGAVSAAAWFVTVLGYDLLPPVTRADSGNPLLPVLVGAVWAFSLLALLLLWRRRPRSALDLWLMVVMAAWLFDAALAAGLHAGGFDLGFYAGRAYGLLAAGLVPAVLLTQTGALYARAAHGYGSASQAQPQQLNAVRAELIHVARMTEVGQVVSALTHEVNQPLTAASNYLRAGRLSLAAAQPARADDAMARAADQLARVGMVIRRLRRFLTQEAGVPRPEAPRHLIEDAVSLAMPGGSGREVQVTLDIAEGLPAVMVDKVPVLQVLLHLIRNAVEAMADSARRELTIQAVRAADGVVELRVTDTGSGLRAELRHVLFQPFVTTRQRGLGMGLSICRSIIEANGGRLWAEDVPGGGARFCFTLAAHVALQGEDAIA